MSYPLTIDRSFQNWTQGLAYDGVITINDGVLHVTGAEADSAGCHISHPARPGETFTFSIIARTLAGQGDTAPRIGIDFPAKGTLANSVSIEGPEWKEYSVSFSVPWTAGPDATITALAGIWTGLAGEAELMLPRLTVSNSVYGALRTIAHALLHVMSSSQTIINTGFTSGGIRDVRVSGGTVFIQIDTSVALDGLRIDPLFFVGATPYNNPTIIPKAGNYDRVTGEVEVRFLDTATGAFTTTVPVGLYFNFKAEL